MGRPRRHFFYGWIIVATMFVNLYVTYSVTYTFSAFILGLETTFPWPRASISFTYSLLMLLVGLTAPFSGMLVDRFGPRRVIPLGNVLIVIGLVLSSQISELWHFYVSYGLITALGISLAGPVPAVTTLSHWFRARRGTANGIALSATGLALTSVRIADGLIMSMGWRTAYLILATVVSISIPLGLLLYRPKPADLELLPDGREPLPRTREEGAGGTTAVAKEPARPQWTLAMAVETSTFWFLLLGTMISAVSNQIVIVHQLGALVAIGYERQFVATAIGLGGIAGWLGKMWWGLISDRIARELAYALGSMLMVSGMLLVAFSHDASTHWLPYVYALMIGGGYSISVLKGSMSADIFQGKQFGGIFGALHLATSIGQAVGPLFAGYVYDITRTYRIAFVVGAVAIIISAVMYFLAAPRKFSPTLDLVGQQPQAISDRVQGSQKYFS